MASAGPLQKISVLVVDDDMYMRKIVRSLLMSYGVSRIYEAADGAAGLEMVQQSRPDVILADWEMPMLNGEEMVKLIRNPKTSPQATVPIIMITAHSQRHRIQSAIQVGVNEIVVKPFSAKALLQRIESVILHPRPFVQLGSYFGPMPRENRTGPVQARDASAFG